MGRSRQPDLGKINGTIRHRQTPATLVIGKFDKMIISKALKSFSSKIHYLSQVELDCGHHDLVEETTRFIING